MLNLHFHPDGYAVDPVARVHMLGRAHEAWGSVVVRRLNHDHLILETSGLMEVGSAWRLHLSGELCTSFQVVVESCRLAGDGKLSAVVRPLLHHSAIRGLFIKPPARAAATIRPQLSLRVA